MNKITNTYTSKYYIIYHMIEHDFRKIIQNSQTLIWSD